MGTSSDAGCYGLKPFIENLIWIHENLAFGDTLTRWGNDRQVYVFERQGYPGLLVALNNDQWNRYPRTVQTSFGPNTQLHDYTGRHPDIWTDGSGQASFTVPRNDHGQSYLCFSRVGYTQAFAFDRRTTTQSLFGAADLDTAPAVNGKPVTAGRLWCQGDTEVVVGFGADTSLWTAEAEILLEIIDAQGKTLAQQDYNTKTLNTMCRAFAHQTGWLVLRVTGQGLAAAGSSYTLTVTYTGAQGLAA